MPRRGFTLVELLLAVALVSVLIVLVAPSMREMIAVQRVRSINAELLTNLQFARSEAVRRNAPVKVSFASDSSQSCYTAWIGGVLGTCNCLDGAGNACSGGPTEIRTVSVPRSLGIELAASSSQLAQVVFRSETGQTDTPDFRVDVVSDVRGQLRTTVNSTGRPSVCTPDGSISQTAPCP